jgi:hypothetical protein
MRSLTATISSSPFTTEADLLKTKTDLLITSQKQSKNYRVALSSEDVDSEYKEV